MNEKRKRRGKTGVHASRRTDLMSALSPGCKSSRSTVYRRCSSIVPRLSQYSRSSSPAQCPEPPFSPQSRCILFGPTHAEGVYQLTCWTSTEKTTTVHDMIKHEVYTLSHHLGEMAACLTSCLDGKGKQSEVGIFVCSCSHSRCIVSI